MSATKKLTPEEFIQWLKDNRVFEDMAVEVNEAFQDGVEAVQRIARWSLEKAIRECVGVEVPE